MKNNIFNYATSELSQDAFLCWILSWADADGSALNINLHEISNNLIDLIFNKAQLPKLKQINKIQIDTQVGRNDKIDVLAVLNNDIYLIIEDKAGTKQHSNQLSRYINYVMNKYHVEKDKIIPIYIQTRDQCDYQPVLNDGYVVITRQDLLHLLGTNSGKIALTKSDILRDFYNFLSSIENEFQSYKFLPLNSWTGNSWIGFYSRVKEELKDGEWDYRSNPSGGFYGFWWHSREIDGCNVFLLLEQQKFCFKIVSENEGNRRELRNLWHNRTYASCTALGLEAAKPSKFGNGTFITVTILKDDYWSSPQLDRTP